MLTQERVDGLIKLIAAYAAWDQESIQDLLLDLGPLTKEDHHFIDSQS